jgi:hypothetical protein
MLYLIGRRPEAQPNLNASVTNPVSRAQILSFIGRWLKEQPVLKVWTYIGRDSTTMKACWAGGHRRDTRSPGLGSIRHQTLAQGTASLSAKRKTSR